MSLSNTAETGAALAKTTTVALYGGAGTAFWGGITANWVAAIGGIVIGVIGLLVKIYFELQHLKLAREKARHEV